MPSLNGKQFQPRLFDPGPAIAGPRPEEGAPPASPDVGVRGPAGHGQFVMNFDKPEQSLLAGHGGIVGVDPMNDPSFYQSAWDIGGGRRGHRSVSSVWESAPVEEIPASRELRTNQVSTVDVKTGRNKAYVKGGERIGGEAYRPLQPMAQGQEIQRFLDQAPEVEEGHIEPALSSIDEVRQLRGSLKFSDRKGNAVRARERGDSNREPTTGDETERLPWIARIEEEPGMPKDYILEGHHRTVASRTRGDGSMRAHVMRARPGHSLSRFVSDFKHQPQKLMRPQRPEA